MHPNKHCQTKEMKLQTKIRIDKKILHKINEKTNHIKSL